MSTLAPVHVLLLAVVLGWAAGSKLRDPAAFRAVLRKLVPSGATSLSLAVPLVEFALAILLLSGWRARACATAAAILLAIFSGALLRMHRLHVGGCGCFGERASGGAVARGLVRNALLAGAALWVVMEPPVEPIWRGGAVVLAGRLTVVTGVICAWACVVGLLDSLAATRSVLGKVSP